MRVGEGFTEWTNVVKAKPLFKERIGLGYFEPRQMLAFGDNDVV
jgi:hypothetical protein